MNLSNKLISFQLIKITTIVSWSKCSAGGSKKKISLKVHSLSHNWISCLTKCWKCSMKPIKGTKIIGVSKYISWWRRNGWRNCLRWLWGEEKIHKLEQHALFVRRNPSCRKKVPNDCECMFLIRFSIWAFVAGLTTISKSCKLATDTKKASLW